MLKKTKQPWQTKAVMAQIYNMHLWGGTEFDFYSGDGSHNPEIINPYCDVLIAFLKSQKKPLIVCDLGCGDFNIGKHLVKHCQSYFAIDIVEKLIDRNKTLFKEKTLEFLCLDITKDKLPFGECVILRQVLQHLSNQEIQHILKQIQCYKYLVLTEHLPLGSFTPNKDIISGQGIRLKQNSGVDILKIPFNFKVIEAKTLSEHILENNKGRLVTRLYKVF